MLTVKDDPWDRNTVSPAIPVCLPNILSASTLSHGELQLSNGSMPMARSSRMMVAVTWMPLHHCESHHIQNKRATIWFLNSITSKTGVKSNIKPPPPPETLILNSHTFDEVALVSKFDAILRFGTHEEYFRIHPKMCLSLSQ